MKRMIRWLATTFHLFLPTILGVITLAGWFWLTSPWLQATGSKDFETIYEPRGEFRELGKDEFKALTKEELKNGETAHYQGSEDSWVIYVYGYTRSFQIYRYFKKRSGEEVFQKKTESFFSGC